MSNCINTIQGGVFEELGPNVITPINFSFGNNQILKVVSTNTQTAIFNFTFNPLQSLTSFVVTVTAFRKSGTELINIGSATFSDLVGNFSKDFSIGEYYLCIQSNNAFNGTVLGIFQGFSAAARLAPEFYEGASLSAVLSTRRKANPCDQALFFELLEGSLPPGIKMTGLGRLNGVLPNLDCLPDALEFPPGFNLSYPDVDKVMHPWGRTWRFKVRVSVQGEADSADEEWFCIRVHNNWDWDRDNFLKNAPFRQVRDIEVVFPPKKLPDNMCMEPCPVEPEDTFAPPVPISPECPACDSPDFVTDIQLIAIPKEISTVSVSDLPAWWLSNRETVFDCPELSDFMKRLNESKYFQFLLAEHGYTAETAPDPRIAIELSSYQNFVQLTAMSLIEGAKPEHIDYIMREHKNRINQKMPIFLNGQEGAAMICQLS